MPIQRLYKARHGYYGLRVQVQANGEIRRQYFSLEGLTPKQRDAIRSQAERLDATWCEWAAKAKRESILSRAPKITLKQNDLGLTGLHLYSSKHADGRFSVAFRVHKEGMTRTFSFSPKRPIQQAWVQAVNHYTHIYGLSQKERNDIMSNRPCSQRLRLYTKYLKAERGISLTTTWCTEAGFYED